MSKEKQIEEMAKVIDNIASNAYIENYDDAVADSDKIADALYNAGYRKQSENATDIYVDDKVEWISVDERLPTAEENDRGLVGIVNGHNGEFGFIDAVILVDYDFEEGEWWSEDYDITNCKVEYWMPLPEPPKMKGGE